MNRSSRRLHRLHRLSAAVVVAFAAVAGNAFAATTLYPDILAAKVQPRGGDVFDFDVKVSSPYDTPKRYADAFRVMNKDGTVYGQRILDHDHQTEQPFTRDLYSVKIPHDVRVVIIQGRDQQSGYGGKTIEAMLPGR